MTEAARAVLEDCKRALSELQRGDITGHEWRLRWVAAIALLRAVGHVLDKVDGLNNPALHALIRAAWERVKDSKPQQPAILWQFIEKERENTLKEYDIVAELKRTTLRPGTAHYDLTTRTQTNDPSLPTLYDYEIKTGRYKGKDYRVVIHEAIEWWEQYLDGIDEEYKPKP